ncbi:endonuclease/exonuclease/phosphatase family protein [Kineosporia rhizophila]|uniref:endonuclease/exonuclease/phosphatase family protein n=1 Tax=Kineosporia TaxID=49184 RepID=UPI001E439CB1|nr:MULTISPECIES: endonuclease/exonuclease/phosphatase family protein [Kineosporia]MCE0538658.1 endonuclease/exonuclease/phosphatase family protein [Kineosporia rhizophila]GLY19433.1 hypothetical protein Kisp01_64470 [Kineosporia sp. NBRC 101677]
MADTSASGAPVRLLTWNVEGARQKHARRQAEWLAASPYDLMVLTGVDAPDGELLQALTEEGLHVLASPLSAASASDRDEHVVVAARHHRPSRLDVPPPREQPHRCLATRLESSSAETDLVLAGVHVPGRGGRSRRLRDKRDFRHAGRVWLPRVLAAAGERPLIVAGDLFLVEPGEDPRCAELAPWECDFYWSWGRMGLTDVYRAVHPRQVDPAPRWFGVDQPREHRAGQIWMSGFRPGAAEGCHYDETVCAERLSTRPALIATLNLLDPAVENDLRLAQA